MRRFTGFEKGMGIGGWLTNYKRFNCLPQEGRLTLTTGDFEHFEGYITEDDVRYISELGMDNIRLGFDQIVLEEKPGVYREEIFSIIEKFIGWCEKYGLNAVLNLHKAIGNYCDIEEKVQLLDNNALQERFVMLWEALEDRFSDKPGVAFELLNEVRDVDPEKWNILAGKTVNALRRKNTERKLIIGAETLAFSSMYGVFSVLAQWLYTVALGRMAVSVCAMIYSFGFIIPTVFGTVVWNENVGFFKIFSVLLCAVTIVLSSAAPGGSKKTDFRAVLPLIISMAASGGLAKAAD